VPLLLAQVPRHRDKIAVRMAESGEALTYGELDQHADAVARWLASLGLEIGDTVALLLENHLRTFELWFGARRAGLYYAPLGTQLTSEEIAFLLRDSGAKVLVTSVANAAVAAELSARADTLRIFMIDGTIPGVASFEQAIAPFLGDERPLPQRSIGREFMYSSGTTGRPKGIRRPLTDYARRMELPALERRLREIFGFDENTIYLSPSPLYHATGRFVIRAIECGGTAIVMKKFDPEQALAAIERYRVTHAHWVPTMFVRLLALPDAVRRRYDLSSMRRAIHASAPCRPDVKERMIEWWGPIVDEYYGGSENVGVTLIDSAGWLAHRGSVGRPISGEVHILDDDENELPPGEIGTIYFAGGLKFVYHNDAEKTTASFSRQGYGTYGDLGHIDRDGFLYISDRRADLIIAGGVNVYPQEVENVLAVHPAVDDVAVVGIPNAEYGEEVKALVRVQPGASRDATLAQQLLEHCRARLSKVKCPRSVDFVDEVPRNDTGKLLRRVLKERYRASS
jgi:long-chain acyl-CoA synthetase